MAHELPYIRIVRRFAMIWVSALAMTGVASAQQTPDPPRPDPTPPTPAPALATPVEPPAPRPGLPTPRPETPLPSDQRGEVEKRAQAERLCAEHAASCHWLETFSSLERSSITRALTKRGYELEPQPWGKVIGHIRVHNEDVFAENNWLQFFNFIHYTTRESAVRSELSINEGEVWDPERVAESSRNLRDPLYSSVIAIVPVKANEPGKVDLFVVTRDVWSLRFNSNYTFQEGSLTNLTLNLSENNFLGHRALLSGGIVMDQGAIAVGPTFIDKNLLGEHLDFRIHAAEIFTRRALAPGDSPGLQDGTTFHAEGRAAAINLSRPLWSLASTWGWGTAFAYSDAIARRFSSTQLRLYNNPDTPEIEQLPEQYRLKTWSIAANAVRQWGSSFKQQVSFGNTVASIRPSLLPTFPEDHGTGGERLQREAFIRDVLPRSELRSEVFVGYSFYVPRYRTLRNVQTYELAEDFRVGPDLDFSIAQGLKLLGSDFNYQRPSLSVGYTFPWCRDGFVRPSASMSVRIQEGATLDNTANAAVRVVTPYYRLVRLVAQASVDTRWNDKENQFFYAGSSAGLRGFRINQFYGDRRTSSVIEARTAARSLWVLFVGTVLFYEVAGAADTFGAMHLHHDAGFGLRVLVPQTSAQVFRFDLAFPLDSSDAVIGATTFHDPAFSPHFVGGFDSYF